MLQWKFDFPWICYVFLWNKENILNLVFTILQYWTPGKVAFELSEQNIETEAMCFCKIYIFELYNTYWNILQHLMYVYIFIWMRKNNKPFRSEYLNSGQRKKYMTRNRHIWCAKSVYCSGRRSKQRIQGHASFLREKIPG